MNSHVSAILLGVNDMERSKRFYTEGLGWDWGGYGGTCADPDGYVWSIGYSAAGKDQPYAE